jgi:hypothetical protein
LAGFSPGGRKALFSGQSLPEVRPLRGEDLQLFVGEVYGREDAAKNANKNGALDAGIGVAMSCTEFKFD